jgi:hypothetical protein
MAAEPRTERIRRLLRQTLDEQLSAEAGAVDSGGRRRRLAGPWSTFFDEKSAWDETTELNRDLYRDLNGQFDDNLIREILLAAADVKISRASLTELEIGQLRAAAQRYGFEIVASQNQWILHADRGKGYWANHGRPVRGADQAGAVRHVYIASDATLAETGIMLDEAGEDDLFGALLGIPACCRNAYERNKHQAANKQFDFVPYVSENTNGAMPYDWRLNYLAQYFGFSLLSFFPCSFDCPAAAAAAERTLSMLARCDPAWADRFVDLQKTNVLYTEYQGLHLFREPLRDGQLAYAPRDVTSTEVTELASLLRQGDRLEVRGKHDIGVYRGATKLGDIAGEDACMCAFH